jgi:hypothetical protein
MIREASEARRRPKDRRVARLLSWQWAKDLADIRSWCAKYRSSFHDNVRAGDHLGAVGDLARLGADGLYPRGIYRVLRREPGGWVDIERAAVYQALSIAVTRAPDATAGATLAHVTAIGQRKLAACVSKVIGHDMRQHPDRWDERYFARFVLHLRRRASGEDAGSDGMPADLHLGPFQSVLDAWTDATTLARALSEVCEYHLGEIGFAKNFGEFETRYDLIPIDIAFIRMMRAQEGLETPALDHPLASTPFGRIPAGPQYDLGEDDLWRRACGLLKEKMPALDLEA